MSDTKKKTNGDSASPSVSKGSKFAEKFNKLFSLCTELKNDAAGVMDYEKTIEENALLKSTLKKRDEELDSLKVEVQRLKQLKDSNLEDFGKKYGEYQTQLKDADDSKRALDAAQEKLQKANKDIKRLEAENKQLEKKARDTINARNTLGDELSEVVAKNTSLQTMLTAEQKKVRFYGEGKLTDKNPDELYVIYPG
jgi:chromosome segregation ATPase